MPNSRWLLLAPAAFLLLVLHNGCEESAESTDIAAAGASSSQGGASAGSGAAGLAAGGAAGQPLPAGQGGTAGKGGAAGKDGNGGKGGKGGGAGKVGSAGQAGAPNVPVWKSVGQAQGAPVERLEQPQSHKLFSWVPCTWIAHPDCEEAVLDGPFQIPQYGGLYTVVHDDGKDVRVAVTITRSDIMVITDADGTIQTALRYHSDNHYISATYIHGSRFALPLLSKGDPTPWGALGEVGGEAPLLFQTKVPKPTLAIGSQGYALSSKRWAWWVGQAAMISFDAFAGNPSTIFSESYYGSGEEAKEGSVTSIESPIQAGDWLMSVEYRVFKERVKPAILLSDGLKLGKVLVPWEKDEVDDSNPTYADTHLMWYRGYGFKDLNVYEHTEMWAAPFTTDPAQLKPFKVRDLEGTFISGSERERSGGWGRVMIYEGFKYQPDGSRSPMLLRIIDLTQPGDPITIEVVSPLISNLFNGITRTHAWFSLGTDYPPTRLVRWKLPPGGTAPAASP